MRVFVVIVLLLAGVPAYADHPGDQLDEVMTEKEPAFEPTDIRSISDLFLTDEQGAMLTLRDLRETIVVLSFVPRDCGASCAEQQDILASVQAQVNITPMKQMVTFLTIRDRGLPIGAQWNHANWQSAVPRNETAAESSRRFTALSDRNPLTPPVHVIDRRSRHAALFHGNGFRKINLVLYINGLTHAPLATEKSEPDTRWGRVMGLFK